MRTSWWSVGIAIVEEKGFLTVRGLEPGFGSSAAKKAGMTAPQVPVRWQNAAERMGNKQREDSKARPLKECWTIHFSLKGIKWKSVKRTFLVLL